MYLCSRKKGMRNEDEKHDSSVDINYILHDIASIKQYQQSIVNEIRGIKSENQLLWREYVDIQSKYQKQTETVDKILRFLASVFIKKQPTIVPKKRKFLLGDKTEGMPQISRNPWLRLGFWAVRVE